MKQALLVIDVQNEYFSGKLPITYPEGSLSKVLNAMDSAISAGIPVIVIQHTLLTPDALVFRKGTESWALHSEVARRPHDLYIEKNFPGSFTGTALQSWLQERGIEKVVICGYMTHMCCDTTSREAYHRGFKVDFLADATGTLSIKNESGAVSAEDLYRTVLIVQQRFARIMTAHAWIGEVSES